MLARPLRVMVGVPARDITAGEEDRDSPAAPGVAAAVALLRPVREGLAERPLYRGCCCCCCLAEGDTSSVLGCCFRAAMLAAVAR
jgi:hypothetical protein